VTNQKGGVGKTTTVANLGAALSQRGVRVCLVDLDPQTHLTMHFGVDPAGLACSMYDVLTGDMPLSRAAMQIDTHLTVLPAVIDLAAAEVELAGAVGREQILADKIAAEAPPFDLLMFDCPPSLSLLTLNALAAVKEVLIPLQPHFLALQGLGKLLETVSLVQRRINPDLRVSGVIFCLYETATRLAAEIIQDVEAFFASPADAKPAWSATRIYATRIRRNIKLAECPSYGTTIHKYDPTSHGAEDYSALAEEFIAAWPGAPVEARPAVAGPDEPDGGPSPEAAPPAEAPAPVRIDEAPEAVEAPAPAELTPAQPVTTPAAEPDDPPIDAAPPAPDSAPPEPPAAPPAVTP